MHKKMLNYAKYSGNIAVYKESTHSKITIDSLVLIEYFVL